MKQIWKYSTPVRGGARSILMPIGAEIVQIGSQNPPEEITFWAIVDPVARQQDRVFNIVGTGHNFDDVWDYRGTVDTNMGLVWHLIELNQLRYGRKRRAG